MGKTQKSQKNESPYGPLKSSPAFQNRQTRAELIAMGKALRDQCPRHRSRRLASTFQPPGSPRITGRVQQGRIEQADSDSLRSHDADAVHLLSRGGAQHGR